MDDMKKAGRDIEVETKKRMRDLDGHDLGDDIGNVGDEIRRDLGNAGDDVRKDVRTAVDDLPRRDQPATPQPERR